MSKKIVIKLKKLFNLFTVFFKIGLLSFGGGYSMLSLIEYELVTKRKWLSHDSLLDIFAIAESTPGAIAINLATFIGTKRAGVFGGLIATIGVVLPSFAIIIGISYAITLVSDNVWVAYFFKAIRIGVLVLISKAVLTFFTKMRKNIFSFILMIGAFSVAFFTNLNVIYIILSAILLSSIAVAFVNLKNKTYYHMNHTTAYYNERIGRPLKKDEYYNDRIFEHVEIYNTIKPIENTIIYNDIMHIGHKNQNIRVCHNCGNIYKHNKNLNNDCLNSENYDIASSQSQKEDKL